MPHATPPPPIVHRFFFAVLPPPRERNRIAALRDTLDPVGSPVRTDRLHVTMGITEDFPDYPDELAERLLAIGDAVRAPPAKARFDVLSAGRGTVVMRARRKLGDLHLLYEELDRPLTSLGLRRAGWNYKPHVTLTYRKGEPSTSPVEPIEWTAEEFVLIHSEVGTTRHTVLKTWPLIARQGALFD